MKIDSIRVKLRFQSSKVRGIERPDVARQMDIIKHINAAMEEWNAHIIDIDVCASIEEPKGKTK